MTQIAITTGFLPAEGREILVRAGTEFDDDDPVVLAHPELFERVDETGERPTRGRVRRG